MLTIQEFANIGTTHVERGNILSIFHLSMAIKLRKGADANAYIPGDKEGGVGNAALLFAGNADEDVLQCREHVAAA